MEALRLPSFKLMILYNEAMRQRAIDSIFLSYAMNGSEELETYLKAHGNYEEGFHEDELTRLKEVLGASRR